MNKVNRAQTETSAKGTQPPLQESNLTEMEEMPAASAGLDAFLLTRAASSVDETPPALMLKRLNPGQRHAIIRNLNYRLGNRYTQRLVADDTSTHQHPTITVHDAGPGRKPVVQRSLRDDVSGQWTEGLATLTNMYSGTGGIIDRQKDAVRNFSDYAQLEDPPSVGEEILLGAINLLLGAALGGIGSVLKSVVARALRPALVGATGLARASGIESSTVRSGIRDSADAIIDKIVDVGKERVGSAVREAWSAGGGAQETAILRFRETQLHALNSIGQSQVRAMIAELARLRATEGEDDEWEAADALYSSFQQSLEAVYDQQFNRMTDAWFNMQVQTVGLGPRAGVLQVELDRRYPHEGSFFISGGSLAGSGSNEQIRERLARRPLSEIEMPKVISMNGQMGYGILDCSWYIEITGEERTEQDTISAPASSGGAQRFTAGPQQVQAFGGNRWGFPWLAAFHLGLEDLDRDDERNSSANQGAGARAVWNAIKDMRVGTIDG